MATSLNGQAQDDLPVLALGHPGTTRTQEGLAVFSEFVSGTLELDRFRRLADRYAIPALCEPHRLGLCRLARHLPPWASDPRWALAWLTYSTFASAIDLSAVTDAVSRLLERAPLVRPEESEA